MAFDIVSVNMSGPDLLSFQRIEAVSGQEIPFVGCIREDINSLVV